MPSPCGFALANPDWVFRIPHRILAGLIAGGVAGTAMAIVFMVAAAGALAPFYRPFQLIAATVLGDAALLPSAGPGTVLLGVGFHFMVSILLSGLFSTLTMSRSRPLIAIAGFFYGAVVWFVMQYVVFPSGVNLAWIARVPRSVFAIAHLIYGVSLLSLIPIETYLIRRELSTPTPGVSRNSLAA